MSATTFRQCNLCEAHCGIRVETADGRVTRITGDPQDSLSRGYICPKAAALSDLAHDPDRLRRPMRRQGDRWIELGWEEALNLAAAGLEGVAARHGEDAVATYFGNPAAHSTGILAGVLLRKLLGGRNHYSATSADQLPQYLVSLEMFGHYAVFPVPDIERTDHILLLGANPAVSNGSIMTAPGVRERLRGVRARGGTVTVVDPRRSETAKLADRHVAIAPGGDPYLLLGMLHHILATGSFRLGAWAGRVRGVDRVERLVLEWSPERAAAAAGIEAAVITEMADEFAAAPRAIAYGRLGLCHQQTGAVAHWLVNVLNTVTGNLDRPGGVMFPRPPIDVVSLLERLDGPPRWGRYHARVSGLPEFNGELPVAGMADELLTPGPGQVRGLLMYAGNPVISTPNGARLDAGMDGLEFCVAVDMYLTESTRHADVILPPLAQLERADVDIVFPALSARNHIRYSPAALPEPADGRTDWQILMGLAARMRSGPLGRIRSAVMRGLSGSALMRTPEPVIDLLLRAGPYGLRQAGRGSLGLSMRKLRAKVHGIDLGELQPNLGRLIRTDDGQVNLAPDSLLREAEALGALADERAGQASGGFDLVLIGRRSLRSNNSWMHNSARLMKGADRCTALMHPGDAEARGLVDGDPVRLTSRVGSIVVPLELTEDIRPGVVSLPHGFGHGRDGVGWRTAAAHPGASANDITDPSVVDRLSGNAALAATMVRAEAAVPIQAPAPPAAAAISA